MNNRFPRNVIWFYFSSVSCGMKIPWRSRWTVASIEARAISLRVFASSTNIKGDFLGLTETTDDRITPKEKPNLALITQLELEFIHICLLKCIYTVFKMFTVILIHSAWWCHKLWFRWVAILFCPLKVCFGIHVHFCDLQSCYHQAQTRDMHWDWKATETSCKEEVLT